MTQSAELTRFYRDYLAWYETGCKAHYIFNRTQGLCSALASWEGRPHHFVASKLDTEQCKLFISEGLRPDLPFDASFATYVGGYKTDNHKRIQWVREHVMENNDD